MVSERAIDLGDEGLKKLPVVSARAKKVNGEQIRTFLGVMYKNCTEGRIEIRSFWPAEKPGGKGTFDEKRFFELGDIDAIIAFCSKKADKNVFFGVGTRDCSGKGTKENIVQIPALWFDRDDKTTPIEEAKKLLADFPINSSLYVDSGGGNHGYFIFSKPMGKDNEIAIKDALKRICHALAGDSNVCEIARIMRMPGTWNNKPDYDIARPVRLLEKNDFEYTIDAFMGLLPVPQKTKTATTTSNTIDPTFTDKTTRYGEVALMGIIQDLKQASEGMRNHALNIQAMKAGQLVAGGQICEAEAFDVLYKAAIDIGLFEGETKATIQSGMKKGKTEPRTVEDKDIGSNIKKLAKTATKKKPDRAKTTRDKPVESAWPEAPVSFDTTELPSFEENDFPSPLWDMIMAVAQCLEVKPELPAMMALAVVATACQKKCEIQIEPGYSEPLNIWTTAPLDSGSRKSAVLKKVMRPIVKWEAEQKKAMANAIKKAQLKRELQEAQFKKLKKKAIANENGDIDKDTDDLANKEAELVEIPRLSRMWTQDSTPEKLAILLEENNESMAVFSAEGGIFDLISGRYSNNIPNLDIYLQSHAGDAVRVDRVGRPAIYLEAPALTMGLSPQPSIIQGLGQRPGFRERGLNARFLYALPKSMVGKRVLEAKPVAPHIESIYEARITALLNKATDDYQVLKLSPAAYEAWKIFQQTVEIAMDEDGDLEHMRDWGGKLPGAIARVAGLFHCVEHALTGPQSHDLSAETMGQAIRLADKLVEHAIAAYGLMGTDPKIEAAQKALAWIIKNGEPQFKLRDCHYGLKRTFKKREDLDPALAILVERFYIRQIPPPKTTHTGGRPSVFYQVHPEVLK
jgi:hypothetical protein